MFRDKGLIHTYTGIGKGKTTAAIGQALRAAGHGARVGIVFFMKGSRMYGEFKSLESIPNITTYWAGRHFRLPLGEETDIDYSEARRGIRKIKEFMELNYDMIIMDEISLVLKHHLVSLSEITNILEHKPDKTEIIMTGIEMNPMLMNFSDLVTEMKLIKHPSMLGIGARKGIEY